MYKSLSFATGGVVAVMVLSNAVMMNAIGNVPSVVLNHIIGFCFALTLMLVTKTKFKSLKGIPFFYLLGGITGIMTVAFYNIAFIYLGATIVLMLSTVGRIATSSIIDHYGLMGRNKYPLKPIKLIGLIMMMIGLALIINF